MLSANQAYFKNVTTVLPYPEGASGTKATVLSASSFPQHPRDHSCMEALKSMAWKTSEANRFNAMLRTCRIEIKCSPWATATTKVNENQVETWPLLRVSLPILLRLVASRLNI